ncbi:MAG: hypothetical protein JSW63_12745 [Ignavibacterium sp.]|nr:MAG: hypothetical protein JSW63_12745 [Ignavibacterium sp.]
MNSELLIAFSKAVRDSTLKRLKTVPEGYENWCISENALSFAEIASHLIDTDEWLIKKLNHPATKSIVAEKGSIKACNRKDFNSLILGLEKGIEKKIELIISLEEEKIKSKIYDDRFNDEVSIEWIILRGNIDHEIHHRGQIAAYLRALEDN